MAMARDAQRRAERDVVERIERDLEHVRTLLDAPDVRLSPGRCHRLRVRATLLEASLGKAEARLRELGLADSVEQLKADVVLSWELALDVE